MKKIGFKLWVILMSLVIFMLILLWGFQIVFLEKFYINIAVNDIKNEILWNYEDFFQKDTPKFYKEMENLVFNNNLSIEIMDSNKNLVFKDDKHQIRNLSLLNNNTYKEKVFNQALAGKESIVTLIHHKFNTKILLVGLPISSNNKSLALIITMPIENVENTVSILKIQLIYISGILLFTSIIVSFFISRSLVKPILKIKEVTEKITLGNYDNIMSIHRKDEIGSLANTINIMSSELSKVDNLRKELIANVSHELRTPLTLIQGYAETIRDVIWNDNTKRNTALNIIIEESKRLSFIVRDILNLSQLESSNGSLQKESFDISSMIENTVEKYTLLKENSHINISLNFKKNIMVYADSKKIEQVFNNLITNSLYHTSENGVIVINTEIENEKVRITIKDNGEGIPPDKLKYIWERFYKVTNKSDKNKPGTGLGLAIVKTILLAHNSDYGIESDGEKGTEVWFTLDLNKECLEQ